MEDYKVYVHIDPEGKRYYGSTKERYIENRWKNGKGYKRQERFWKAIEMYGWSNIQHIIIAKGLSKDEAKWLEEELIREFDTTNPENGYNKIIGDAIAKGKVIPEDTRKKIGDAKIGCKNPMYGKYGKNNPRAKSVICLTTKRIFYTAKEGARYYGIATGSDITKCCKGKHNSAGKYQGKKLVWRYLVWKHDKKFRKLVSK